MMSRRGSFILTWIGLVVAPMEHGVGAFSCPTPTMRRSSVSASQSVRPLCSTASPESSQQESDTSSSALPLTDEEMQLLQDIYDADAGALRQNLQNKLSTIPPSLLVRLRQFGATHENAAVRSVAEEFEALLQQEMTQARQTLKDLLEAGEIRVLDSRIGKYAREGKLNVPFFQVLTINLQDAVLNEPPQDDAADASDGEEGSVKPASRAQILQHIYTRCQEEVEKQIPPGTALLNKLLRTEEEPIRLNIYEHYLIPQETTKIVTPDGKEVELKGSGAPLVTLDDFIDAIEAAIKQIRTVEQAGGASRAAAADMVESCRNVAKEARIVVGRSFGVDSKEVRILEERLQPVFRPSSAHSPYIQGET